MIPGNQHPCAGARSEAVDIWGWQEKDTVRVEAQNTRREAGSRWLRTGGDGGERCRSHG